MAPFDAGPRFIPPEKPTLLGPDGEPFVSADELLAELRDRQRLVFGKGEASPGAAQVLLPDEEDMQYVEQEAAPSPSSQWAEVLGRNELGLAVSMAEKPTQTISEALATKHPFLLMNNQIVEKISSGEGIEMPILIEEVDEVFADAVSLYEICQTSSAQKAYFEYFYMMQKYARLTSERNKSAGTLTAEYYESEEVLASDQWLEFVVGCAAKEQLRGVAYERFLQLATLSCDYLSAQQAEALISGVYAHGRLASDVVQRLFMKFPELREPYMAEEGDEYPVSVDELLEGLGVYISRARNEAAPHKIESHRHVGFEFESMLSGYDQERGIGTRFLSELTPYAGYLALVAHQDQDVVEMKTIDGGVPLISAMYTDTYNFIHHLNSEREHLAHASVHVNIDVPPESRPHNLFAIRKKFDERWETNEIPIGSDNAACLSGRTLIDQALLLSELTLSEATVKQLREKFAFSIKEAAELDLLGKEDPMKTLLLLLSAAECESKSELVPIILRLHAEQMLPLVGPWLFTEEEEVAVEEGQSRSPEVTEPTILSPETIELLKSNDQMDAAEGLKIALAKQPIACTPEVLELLTGPRIHQRIVFIKTISRKTIPFTPEVLAFFVNKKERVDYEIELAKRLEPIDLTPELLVLLSNEDIDKFLRAYIADRLKPELSFTSKVKELLVDLHNQSDQIVFETLLGKIKPQPFDESAAEFLTGFEFRSVSQQQMFVRIFRISEISPTFLAFLKNEAVSKDIRRLVAQRFSEEGFSSERLSLLQDAEIDSEIKAGLARGIVDDSVELTDDLLAWLLATFSDEAVDNDSAEIIVAQKLAPQDWSPRVANLLGFESPLLPGEKFLIARTVKSFPYVTEIEQLLKDDALDKYEQSVLLDRIDSLTVEQLYDLLPYMESEEVYEQASNLYRGRYGEKSTTRDGEGLETA